MKFPPLYWHIHHDRLFEFATEPITRRREYIKTKKPVHEVALRLKLLKKVKLTQEIIDLLETYNNYYDYDYYYYYNYYHDYYNYNYLGLSLDDQIAIYVLVASYQLTEKLHEEQCPNCPWDGEIIVFPE